jgi:hypothetical protein
MAGTLAGIGARGMSATHITRDTAPGTYVIIPDIAPGTCVIIPDTHTIRRIIHVIDIPDIDRGGIDPTTAGEARASA